MRNAVRWPLILSVPMVIGACGILDDDVTVPSSPSPDTPAVVTAAPVTSPAPTAGVADALPTGPPVGEGASAGGDGDRVGEERGWDLAEVTADGRHVAVTVGFGGCDRYFGPDVRETADEVEIVTVFTVPAGMVACTAELQLAQNIVRLQRPLGDRTLTGCGRGDCLAVDDAAEISLDVPRPAISGDVVVAGIPDGIVGLDAATGEERWRLRHRAEPLGGHISSPTAVGQGGVMVQVADTGLSSVLDAADGSLRWSAAGGLEYSRWLDAHTSDDAVLLTPDLTSLEMRDAGSGEVRWQARPPGQIITQLVSSEDAVVVLSGRHETADRAGHSTLTRYALADGTALWQRELPGAPGDMISRPGLAVVEVLGAVYGIDIADGSERWRLLPFNVAGLIDAGPRILAYPGRYGDPLTVIDPATGDRDGKRPFGAVGNGVRPDLRRHPVIDGEAVVADDGTLTRRDVTDTLLIDADPDPAWTSTQHARLSPATVAGDTVVVGTPLGARAVDVVTGELLWAYADTG